MALCILAGTSNVRPSGNDGRWWWDAQVGVSQRNTRNLSSGVEVARYDQQDLQASWGLNGYIVHPLVAGFRIDADLLLSKFDGTSRLDSDHLGLGVELNALPLGAFPSRLYYRRKHFGYSRPDSGPNLSLRGTPEVSTTWGGRVRLRRGPLKGTLLGLEHQGLDFLDPDERKEVNQRQFLHWIRSHNSNQHRIRLEKNLHDFGRVDLRTDDLTLRVEDRVLVSPNWLWHLNGDGVRRESSSSASGAWEVDDYRLTNRFQGTVRENDVLAVVLAMGLTRYSRGSSIDAQAGSVSYQWRPNQAWLIGPFVQYDRQSGADRSLSSPRAGVTASWSGRGRNFDNHFTARTSYGAVRQETAEGSDKDRRLAHGISASFAHGDARSLRKSLELEWFRNEFRVQRERLIDLPDLGLSGQNLGADDLYRVRIDLSHASGPGWIRGWGEWSRQSGTRDDFGSGLERETYRVGGSVTIDRVNLQGDVGQTTLEQSTSAAEQRIEFASAIATWRPLRFLSVHATYQLDRRQFDLFSNIDGTNLEAKMILRFGLFSLDTSVIERTENLMNGGDRTNRTIRWNLTSRFGGWLPVVTGTKRRGVIR